jgi:aldose 1-epimerase
MTQNIAPKESSLSNSVVWGILPGNVTARLFSLKNASGMEVLLSDLGATLVSWFVPDERTGTASNILLGHDTPQEYVDATTFMGGTIGRWANRIGGGRFVLRGTSYQVQVNEGRNHLHGGQVGFHRQLWAATPFSDGVTFSLDSPAGDAGFPANVRVHVTYVLNEAGELKIDFAADADAPTPFNLTNHAYFNLAGHGEDIRGHEISIDANQYFEVDEELLPIRKTNVADTPFDFRNPAAIEERLYTKNDQLFTAGGFDHCYVLTPIEGKPKVRRAAVLTDSMSRRQLEVWTDAPSLQFYTGNFLAGVRGRYGCLYQKYAGLCLEPGAFPNALNLEDGVEWVVEPGRPYRRAIHLRVQTP